MEQKGEGKLTEMDPRNEKEKDIGKDEKDDKRNIHVEQLLTTLDVEQWKSLSHIRNVAYPTTLGDKIKLLSKMMVI